MRYLVAFLALILSPAAFAQSSHEQNLSQLGIPPATVGTYCVNWPSLTGVPSYIACSGGGGGSMTWPASAGVPNYTGSSSWGTSYSAANTLPANFLPPALSNSTSINGTTIAPSAGTAPGSTGSFTVNDCLKVGSTSPLQIADNGASCGAGGGMVYPPSGIPSSTGTAWGSSYTTSGAGSVVALATSPTFITPNLGTPTAVTLTNGTGLPISTGVSGLGTGVATFLVTPSSANLAAAVTGETGTGALVFATSPTLVTPAIGAATGTSLSVTGQLTSSVATGTAPLVVSSTTNVANLNASSLNGATFAAPGTIGGTTPGAGAFSSLTDTGVTGSTQCLHANSSGVVSGTGSDCGSGGGAVSSVSGSGAVTSTPTTGAVVVSLTPQTNNTILGNASGSSASPIALTSAAAIGVLTSGTPNAQVGTSYTTVLGDGNGEVTMANASANTLTIPANASVAYNIGTVITIQQLGAGNTSVTPASGVTFQSGQFGSSATQAYPLGGLYAFIQLQKAATNTWNVIAYMPAGNDGFALSGTCTTSAHQGGPLAGTITMSSAGNCTIIVTPNDSLPASHGWTGGMADRTQPTIPAWRETSSSTTAVTFTVPTAVATTDVLSFGPIAQY